MTADSTGSTTPTRRLVHLSLDTTAGSVLHKIPKMAARLGLKDAFALAALYISAVLLTLSPLVLIGWFTATEQKCTEQMSVFCDSSTIFMFLLSFPSLLLLTVTDDQMLGRALYTVQVDGTVTISKSHAVDLTKLWHERFLKINLLAQALGVIAGVATAIFIFNGATTEANGWWIARDRQLLPIGYVFLYCIILFSAIAAIYVVRSFFVGILLRDIAAKADLHMLPLHPDKAGGLQPIGNLGLRNQYGLTIFGFNIVLAGLVLYLFAPKNPYMLEMVFIATAAYMLIGPVIFVAPLLPFRGCMMRAKSKLMTEVAVRMRTELDNVRSRLQSGKITSDDEQLIERLRKIGSVIDDLPVWPFDAVTRKKFFTAYVTPLLTTFALPAAKFALKYLEKSGSFQQ